MYWIPANIRNFLTHEWPNDPPIPPAVDPWRFQSIDKIITRSKWLPSVQKIASNTHIGFPSNHYLLEMVLKVKLNSPPPKQPPKPRFDYSAVFGELRRKFSPAFKKAYGSSRTTPPETSAISEKWEIWTDGSGSRGRCTSQTPAGWGYVVAEQDEIIMEASGPVVTSSTSQFYLGASVGSNNTGEISALVEAALYLLSLTQPPRKVKFFYDSK